MGWQRTWVSETPPLRFGRLQNQRALPSDHDEIVARERGPIRYSFVIPIFNEEAVLPALLLELDRLLATLDGLAEVIFVDDGSRDFGADMILTHAQDHPEYCLLQLSKNFGHQAAITAGMDHTSGEAVIIMDGDLQDPPALVPKLVEKWKEGYDIVYARRAARDNESSFKRASAWLFYRFLRFLTAVDIPKDAGDFRLVDKSVIESFRSMHERDRFVRGMFAWMGYRQTAVSFTRPERGGGCTKYGFRKMARLAADGVFAFSDAPLRIAVWTGITLSFVAVLCGFYAIALRLWRNDLVPGWASTIVVVAFLSGMNMLMTGIVGLYVGRIHREVKARPLYLVRRRFGHFGDRGPQSLSRTACFAEP